MQESREGLSGHLETDILPSLSHFTPPPLLLLSTPYLHHLLISLPKGPESQIFYSPVHPMLPFYTQTQLTYPFLIQKHPNGSNE